MTRILSLVPRFVQAKGAFPSTINEAALENYLLEDELESITLLDKIPKQKSSFQIPILLYPGSGADVIFPLLYLEKLFPETKKAVLMLVDKDNYLPLIKTILDDLNISFAEQQGELQFHWKELFVQLRFMRKDIFAMLDNLPEFNIYFERAFRIMKSEQKDYEEKIFQSLPRNGFIISDSGFQQFPLQIIPVPEQLSSYGEMVFGIKK